MTTPELLTEAEAGAVLRLSARSVRLPTAGVSAMTARRCACRQFPCAWWVKAGGVHE